MLKTKKRRSQETLTWVKKERAKPWFQSDSNFALITWHRL